MKTRILFTMYTLSVLIVLASVPCWAQAEIDPDHFDNPAVVPAPKLGRAAAVKRTAGNFQGSFTLRNPVNYGGRSLAPGNYSISIRQQEKWDVVTVVGKQSAVRIKARVTSPLVAGYPLGLVIERSGEQRRLAGIRLQESGTMLSLPAGKSRRTLIESELIPISYAR